MAIFSSSLLYLFPFLFLKPHPLKVLFLLFCPLLHIVSLNPLFHRRMLWPAHHQLSTHGSRGTLSSSHFSAASGLSLSRPLTLSLSHLLWFQPLTPKTSALFIWLHWKQQEFEFSFSVQTMFCTASKHKQCPWSCSFSGSVWFDGNPSFGGKPFKVLVVLQHPVV